MDPRIIVIILLTGIVIGLIAVRIAFRRSYGYAISAILGVLGSLLGYWLFSYLKAFSTLGLWGTLISAGIGAILILLVAGLRRAKRK